MGLRRDLSYFDLVNIVIGSVVGSDIYIVPGLVAGLVGPFSIAVWVVGGIFAMILALVFAYCAYYVPEVGGSFVYASRAFDDFYGFIAGWSMSIAEILSLPVFAIVFTYYLEYFFPLSYAEALAIRVAFIVVLVAVNVVGVRAAGRLNDILTLAKLAPLLLIIIFGLGLLAVSPGHLQNYVPFSPLGFGSFGTALVLIFWAYAGFELGTLPAREVVDPKRNLPRAMVTGMVIVIFFYIVTNVSVFGVLNWAKLSSSPVPLILVSTALLGSAGAVITGVGALASVAGVDEAEVLGTARLLYSMSKEGLLPRSLGKIHRRFKTPHYAVMLQGAVALALTPFSGISQFISFAVFNLAVCYLLVCLSLAVLKKDDEHGLRGQSVLPWAGVAVSIYLVYSTALSNILVGLAVVLLGVPVYYFYAKKARPKSIEAGLGKEELVLVGRLERQNKFLGDFAVLLHRFYRWLRSLREATQVETQP